MSTSTLNDKRRPAATLETKQAMMEALQLISRPTYAAPAGKNRSRHGRRAFATRPAPAVAVETDVTNSDGWAEDLWNSHGPSVYSLAIALLGDQTAAMQAVALGMVDFVRRDISTPAEDTGRTLARLVYLRSSELVNETATSADLTPALRWLAQLAQLQRASLALCAFGGHTYEDAAQVLGIAPLTVAQLLTSGLNELSRLSRT